MIPFLFSHRREETTSPNADLSQEESPFPVEEKLLLLLLLLQGRQFSFAVCPSSCFFVRGVVVLPSLPRNFQGHLHRWGGGETSLRK